MPDTPCPHDHIKVRAVLPAPCNTPTYSAIRRPQEQKCLTFFWFQKVNSHGIGIACQERAPLQEDQHRRCGRNHDRNRTGEHCGVRHGGMSHPTVPGRIASPTLGGWQQDGIAGKQITKERGAEESVRTCRQVQPMDSPAVALTRRVRRHCQRRCHR